MGQEYYSKENSEIIPLKPGDVFIFNKYGNVRWYNPYRFYSEWYVTHSGIHHVNQYAAYNTKVLEYVIFNGEYDLDYPGWFQRLIQDSEEIKGPEEKGIGVYPVTSKKWFNGPETQAILMGDVILQNDYGQLMIMDYEKWMDNWFTVTNNMEESELWY